MLSNGILSDNDLKVDPFRLSLPRRDVSILQYPFAFRTPQSLLDYSACILGLDTQGLSMDDLMLILGARMHFFTSEDMSLIFGGLVRNIKASLKEFVRLKYVASKRLPTQFCQSRIVYYMTKAGYESAFIRAQRNIEPYGKFRVAERAIVHSLGTAKTGFMAFTSGIPHSLKIECYIDDAIRTDMVLFMYPNGKNVPSRVYVEEDTGAEKKKILSDKIRGYIGKINHEKDCIFFSFFSPEKVSLFRYNPSGATEEKRFSLTAGETVFGKNELSEILDAFSQYEEDGLYDLFSIYERNVKELYLAFLYSVGGCVRGEDGFFDDPTDVVVDEPFVKRYKELSEYFRNPYVLSKLNGLHIKLAHNTMRTLAGTLISDIGDRQGYTFPILGGFRIYCVPTPIASDGLMYLFMDSTRVASDVAKAAGLIYGKKCVYKAQLTEPVNITENTRVRFRNAFVLDNGESVAVEPICFDVGAWARIYCYLHKKEQTFPIKLLCIYDDEKQKDSFLDFLGYNELSPCAGETLQLLPRGEVV